MAEKEVDTPNCRMLFNELFLFRSRDRPVDYHVPFFLRSRLDWHVRYFRFFRVGFGKALHLSSNYIFIICSFFLILLFIENFRTSREYLNSYVLQNPVSPGVVMIAGLGGALVTLLANPDASGKIISRDL